MILHRRTFTGTFCILTALMLSQPLAAWNPEWYRETNPDLDQALKDLDAQSTELIEQRRAWDRYARETVDELAALPPAERETLLRDEFSSFLEVYPGPSQGLEDTFVTGALRELGPEFPTAGTVSLIDPLNPNPRVELTVGDSYEIEHPDVSLFRMVVAAIDDAEKTVTLQLGDGRWTIDAQGNVTAMTAEELRALHLDMLSRWDPETPLVSWNANQTTFDIAMEGVIGRSRLDRSLFQRTGGIPGRELPHRIAARPLDYHLSLLCMSYGFENNQGVVWERIGDRIRVRPFPVVGEAVLTFPPPHRLLSMNEDATVATIDIHGEPVEVMLFDFVDLPLAGHGSAQGIVGHLDSEWREVHVDCAGDRLIFTEVDPELRATEVYVSGDSSLIPFVLPISRNLDMTVTVDPSASQVILRDMGAQRQPFGDVLDTLSRRYGLAYRWKDDSTLVIGSPEALGRKDFR